MNTEQEHRTDTYTFIAYYVRDVVEVIIEASSEREAIEHCFGHIDQHVRPGWRFIQAAFTSKMPTTQNRDRMEMVRAAKARSFVMIEDGRIGRLVRWDSPNRPNTCRIAFTPDSALTMKCHRVIRADINPTEQEQQ